MSEAFPLWAVAVVPVRVNDALDEKFILDTGGGANTISAALCKQIGCKTSGEIVGKRMSGQEIRFPRTTLGALQFGSHRVTSVPAAVFDLATQGLDPSIQGFISLSTLKDVPFTIDYRAHEVIVEDEASLKTRRARGVAVTVRRSDEADPIFDIFLGMKLANGKTLSLEVDTGSDAMIFNDTYLGDLGITLGGPAVKPATGTAETGHTYARYFTKIPGPVSVAVAPEIQQREVPVQVQHIVYDGLVGDAFLNQFTVTYDMPHMQMIFAKPE